MSERRMGDEWLAETIRRCEKAPEFYKDLLAAALDLRDARAELDALRAALNVIGFEPIGPPDASVVTIYAEIVNIARAALAATEPCRRDAIRRIRSARGAE